jgi:hypothetical protein
MQLLSYFITKDLARSYHPHRIIHLRRYLIYACIAPLVNNKIVAINTMFDTVLLNLPWNQFKRG